LPGFLPCGFFPFDVFPMMGSHSPQGYPPPGFCSLLSVSHALKVLLRPPPAGLVSCRSRPWGFPSGPISTRRAVRPLERLLPSCGWSENLHFRAFVPASVSRFRKSSKADPETATLLGFTSLGVSPFSPVSEDDPLLGFMGEEHESYSTIALQSVADEKIGLTLSSLPPLSRFAHLIGNPILRRRNGAGLLLGGPEVLPLPGYPSTRHPDRLPELFGSPFR
jgi:hypothetical protein